MIGMIYDDRNDIWYDWLPVIEYYPVFPIAPPKSILLVWVIWVIVCPNLGNGLSPVGMNVSIVWINWL